MVSEKWRETLLPPGSTIQQAIQCLEQSGLKIALAVDDVGTLLGTISDGDVRRGLLRGCALGDPAELIMFRDPLVVSPHTGSDTVRRLMLENSVFQMPIVDDEHRVVGLDVIEEMVVAVDRPNLVVVMAGGKGTRLGIHTLSCPKPLLPIGDKPIIDHIIERARQSGFHHFVVAIRHLGSMIEEHLGDGSALGVHVAYAREHQALGTAGALSLLDPRPTEPILVSNGDVLTDLRYSEILDFHLQHGAFATMAVRSYEWRHPFGVVRTQGLDITGFEEKPLFHSHVNAGIYVVDPAALDYLEYGGYCDIPTLFERLRAADRKAIVYPMHEDWLDIGSPADLERARQRYEPNQTRRS